MKRPPSHLVPYICKLFCQATEGIEFMELFLYARIRLCGISLRLKFNWFMRDFRRKLKYETQDAHRRVDMKFGALDVSKHKDYYQFLSGQLYGHLSVRDAFLESANFNALDDRIEAIKKDIYTLGGEVHDWDIGRVSADYHSLGLRYVIAGSLHGTNVLRSTWKRSNSAAVLAANHFMNFQGLQFEWVDMLNALNEDDFSILEQNAIISAANYAFGLFEKGIDTCRNRTGHF